MLFSDDSHRMPLRLSVTTSVSVGIAYWFAWPLAFLTPLFVWGFLKLPKKFSWQDFLQNMIAVVVGCITGMLTSSFVIHYPYLFLIITIFLLWFIFYMGTARRISSDVSLWLIIGITLLPMLSLQSGQLTLDIVGGLIFSAFISCTIAFAGSIIFDFHHSPENSGQSEPQSVLTNKELVVQATSSLMVVAPVIILFFGLNWVDKILILIFIAITAQITTREMGKKLSTMLLFSNIIGGLIAIVIYNLIVAVPTYTFMMFLMFGASLLCANLNFSERNMGSLIGMSFTTTLLLIGGAVAPYGAEIDAKFITRILQIMVVVLYMSLALRVVNAVWQSR